MLLTTIIDPWFKNIIGTQKLSRNRGADKWYEEHEHDLLESSPSDQRDWLLPGEEATVAEASLSSELEKYLAEPPPPRQDNPLTWW